MSNTRNFDLKTEEGFDNYAELYSKLTRIYPNGDELEIALKDHSLEELQDMVDALDNAETATGG